MLKPALIAFGRNLCRAMPPIFVNRQYRDHSLKRRNQSLHVVSFRAAYPWHFWSSRYPLAIVFFQWKKKINTWPQMTINCREIRHFHQSKVYDSKTKSLASQNGLSTTCLRLIQDVLDMPKSTNTTCWSYLLTTSENLVRHLYGIITNWVPARSSFHYPFYKNVYELEALNSLLELKQ